MEKLNIVKQILKCLKKGILKSTLDHVHKSTHPAFKGRFREKYLGSVRTLSGALKEKGHVALKRGRGEGGGTEFLRGNGAERESLIASRI